MKTHILILFTIIALLACKEATLMPFPQDDVRPTYYKEFPLQVGNHWTYEITDDKGNVKDSMTMTLSDKYDLPLKDTTVECFAYDEVYKKNKSLSSTQGKMFVSDNKLYSSLNLRSDDNKKQLVVLADYPLAVGKEWKAVLFDRLPGRISIKELRKINRIFDTTFAGKRFTDCADISISYVYDFSPVKDAHNVGRYFIHPSIGKIYEEISIDSGIIEKRHLKEYKITTN